MIDQFSELIKLSNECCNFSELTTSMTEVNALREGVAKFNPSKISLTSNQLSILVKSNINSLMQYIVDQPSGSLSVLGRDLIESTITINPDFLFLFECLSRFDNSNPPKIFNEILSEKLDPLSYFIFMQELFDTFSIPSDMSVPQDALSDIVRYALLHTKRLALTENISKLNIEILKITKKVQVTNLNLFKPLFQSCLEKSINHKNRISKETVNNTLNRLLEAATSNRSKALNENKTDKNLLLLITDLIHYESYLKYDSKQLFYPFCQRKGETIDEAKSKTSILIEKLGKILTNKSFTDGCYVIKISVNWEKKFKGTRLSNASFLELTYQNIKQTYEINNTINSNDKDKDKDKRRSSTDINVNIENSMIEIVYPAFSKTDDKVEISLVYVKEKFTDTQRDKVLPEGFGILCSFSFQLTQKVEKPNSNSQTQQKNKTKSKSRKTSIDNNNNNNNNDNEFEDENNQPFVIEFKRKEKALSTKCGSISITTKYYDLQHNNIPELFQNNPYLRKSENNGYSDNFHILHFLDFFIAILVNEWIIGKPYKMSTTGTTSILMSIYPPQEYYIGLIEFSMRYSIPASTVYLRISKSLLNAWCHAESYLNAFTAMFISAYVSMMNNKKRIGTMFLNEEEEELYQFIIDFLHKNVPMFMIQHLSKPALYQKHAFLPLFMLLSFVIPEEKIDSYVDQLIETSHKNIIKSVTGYLKPTKLENDQKKGKIIPEVVELMKYVNNNNSSMNEITNINSNDDEEKKVDDLDLTDVTFTVNAIAETMEMLNKRTKQLSKFYEDFSLPNFINQWEAIKNEFCHFAILLVKMFFSIQNRNDCADQSVFKFIFAYREIYLFFGMDEDDDEEDNNDDNNNENNNNNQRLKDILDDDEIAAANLNDDDDDDKVIISPKKVKFEKIPNEFSPFKLFFEVILDWISKIGDQMIVWTTNAVKLDKFEIEDHQMSSSPKDLILIFKESFNFIESLHWEDPSIEVFIETFLGLCGSCLRNYAETLTIKMLSYFPVEVIREAKIHEIFKFADVLEVEKQKQNEELKITPRKIFVIINDFVNLKFMWNNFLTHVKKMFPTFFPEEEIKDKSQNEIQISLNSNSNSNLSTNSLFNTTPLIRLPSQIADPVPNLTAISNSIPNLFSRLTSHDITKTVSPHLWVKNSTMKQVFVKKASLFVLNPEFFKSMSPIYNDIFDKITKYIKDKFDDLKSTICIRYYKTMIIAFLFGLDSGMMNLLVMHSENDEPIKNKRLRPILDFIQKVYNELCEYIIENSIENTFTKDEKIENYTPLSQFMFNHIDDDVEKLVQFVEKNYENSTIYFGNENDHDFLIIMCAFIIISSQTNDKRPKVKEWINTFKSRFVGKHFYPPKYK